MAKICGFCGKRIGIFSSFEKLSDGFICGRCLKKACINHFPRSMEHSVEDIKPIFTERIALAKSFRPEKIDDKGKLEIDKTNQLFSLCGNLYKFSDLVHFHQYVIHEAKEIDIEEEGNGGTVGALIGAAVLSSPRITKNGKVKRSLVGSAAGAAIGGKIGKSLSKHESTTTVIVDYMVIDIVLSSEIAKHETIKFNISKKKKRKRSKECIEQLEQIIRSNESLLFEQNNDELEASTDDKTAKTIERFYELYKNGAITMAEYSKKKNELLGFSDIPPEKNR